MGLNLGDLDHGRLAGYGQAKSKYLGKPLNKWPWLV